MADAAEIAKGLTKAQVRDMATLDKFGKALSVTSWAGDAPRAGYVHGGTMGRLRNIGLAFRRAGYPRWEFTPLGREVAAALRSRPSDSGEG